MEKPWTFDSAIRRHLHQPSTDFRHLRSKRLVGKKNNNRKKRVSCAEKMAFIYPVKGVTPRLGARCFVAENATIVGDVTCGDECSFWFNAVVRGDVHYIVMGNKVNVQDGAIIHCTYQKAPTTIGNNVSIGHRAIVHGCTIEDNVLIGMGAIVMDHCIIESNSIIAAGAVLLEGTRVTAGSVYAGVPAKKVKEVSKELFDGEIKRIADNYVMYSGWFADSPK
jgi:carbonic anhydrase/acetyltransferase-like protein (isoleucine patch superfamily)